MEYNIHIIFSSHRRGGVSQAMFILLQCATSPLDITNTHTSSAAGYFLGLMLHLLVRNLNFLATFPD